MHTSKDTLLTDTKCHPRISTIVRERRREGGREGERGKEEGERGMEGEVGREGGRREGDTHVLYKVAEARRERGRS